MFDLITGTNQRPLRERAPASKVAAVTIHAGLLVVLISIPLLRVDVPLPQLPTIMAFVSPSPAAPPPAPPPPALQRRNSPEQPEQPEGLVPSQSVTAPTLETSDVKAEPTTGNGGVAAEGGVEGGAQGGTSGGIVGGLVTAQPPPPPPPAPAAPVRITGQLVTPALLNRVEPVYPAAASEAHLSGSVILEVVVDTQGRVESVKVLRSRHPWLDNAAIQAIREWRYSPLVLNGSPTPFVLTVTFTFHVAD
jgi:protein TonB